MFIIKMVGKNIKINNKYEAVLELCNDYITNEKNYDIEVSATDEEIESLINEECTEKSECESIAIYKKICNELLKYNCMFFHSSVVEVDGQCYCFSAKSGVGKSTHTQLWLDYFKDRARIINGDKPIIEVLDNSLIAHGSPWCGKEGKNINTSSYIKSICFIERAKENSIEEISYKDALNRILDQLEYPKNKEQVNKLFDLVEQLLQKTKFYLLKCNTDKSAVEIAYEGMNGKYMKLKEGLVIRQFKDDYIVVATGLLVKTFPNNMILNEAGADMFNLLAHDISREEMIEELLKKYEDDIEGVTANVDNFIQVMKDNNLLEE